MKLPWLLLDPVSLLEGVLLWLCRAVRAFALMREVEAVRINRWFDR